jgi:AraC-like DNA-binding protein
MDDRLVWLLQHFELRASVFQAGAFASSVRFEANDGLSYIHVLRRGHLRVETENKVPIVVERPSLLFYMNPTDHQLTALDPTCTMICGSFEFGAGLRNPLAQALPDVLMLGLESAPALAATLEVLFAEAIEHHCGRQAVLDRLIEVIIIQLLRDLMDQHRLQVGLLAGLADPRLMKAINAMHADASRAWSLADLATVAGMSRARFAARFRDVVGLTPGSYLGEWRLGLAQALLRKGKSVQMAADAVGYGSASALSRAFSAQVGQSPTEWLKQDQREDSKIASAEI